MRNRPLCVCVVGAGPRGTVMLERLCANAPLLAPGCRIDVHVMDANEPGGGRVWRSDQCRLLLMNTVAGDVTVFTDDTVPMEGPVLPGPSQYEWARMVARGEVPAAEPETAAEAARMEPWSYASRAFQGRYLGWCFRHLAETAPAGMRVHVHRCRAVGIDDAPDGRQVVRLEDGSPPVVADAVVLSQGHTDVTPTATERRLSEYAAAEDLVYVPSLNPAEADLSGIPAGEPVVLRGLGLNFFDYMALLTEGRGGRFSRRGDRLVYHPSGAEPLLWAGSGRGVPYTARAEIRQAVVHRYRPRFLMPDVIARLRERAGTGANDFMRDLWPFVAKEVGWVYYGHPTWELPERDRARFEAEYPTYEWGSEHMEALLDDLFPDPSSRWDWDRVGDPLAGREFADREELQAWTLEMLRRDARESRVGPAGSPRKATAAMLRDLRDEVRQVVSHQGISGESYRQHIDGWFSWLNNYLASGPPAARIEELIALVEAGIVRFLGPRMRVETPGGAFVASSAGMPGESVQAPAMIEAHLPLIDLRRTEDPLLRDLLATGRCRPHVIPNADGSGYETGGLDVVEGTLRVVDARGEPHPGRFSYGPPIESVQWVTQIGARPYVSSRTLLQGDAIARGALRRALALRAGTAQRTSSSSGYRSAVRASVA
ncbi:MAG TPA: FAD/NAD(P)-binding protein [Candidatus Dormibacteraeota bacterium]|nr:FAD/NAD(P)-binding protein [Candidatus Dormibacteraeota bacterium]